MCLTPIVIKNKRTDENQSVPCGRCPKCISRRISGWSFRLMNEERYSDSAYFITLTYDIDHVPLSKKGYMLLNKRHVQLWLKKLRKLHPQGSRPIKYYAAGEYGGKGYRPHYHIIIFNSQLELMVSKKDHMLLELDGYDGKQPVTIPTWEHGHATVGKVSAASVGYTLKYMCKPKRIPLHANDDRLPEFALMSKSWGLLTSPLIKSDGITMI